MVCLKTSSLVSIRDKKSFNQTFCKFLWEFVYIPVIDPQDMPPLHSIVNTLNGVVDSGWPPGQEPTDKPIVSQEFVDISFVVMIAIEFNLLCHSFPNWLDKLFVEEVVNYWRSRHFVDSEYKTVAELWITRFKE